MKSQISFIEFLTSVLIFITFVGYFSIQILMFIPSYIREIKAESLRSEAFQVSELLVNDPGEPLDWTLNMANAKRIGLSDHSQNKTNLLSSIKIFALNLNCQGQSDYENVKSKIGLDYDFSLIMIEGGTGILKIDCRPSVTKFRYVNTTIRRIVAYVDYSDNEKIKYGEMIVQVW